MFKTAVDNDFLWRSFFGGFWVRYRRLINNFDRFFYNFCFFWIERRLLLIRIKWIWEDNIGGSIIWKGIYSFEGHDEGFGVCWFCKMLIELMESFREVAVLKVNLFHFWYVVFECVVLWKFRVGFQKLCLFGLALVALGYNGMAVLSFDVWEDTWLKLIFVIALIERDVFAHFDFEDGLCFVKVELPLFIFVDFFY